jgi:beta-lactam-binding protein with PASTA domain
MSDDERTQVMNAGRRQPADYDEYEATAYDEEAERRRRRKRNWLIALLVLLGIGAIAFVMWLAGAFKGGAEVVAVPRVVGQTEAQAESTLRDAMFTDLKRETVPCHPVPGGEAPCVADQIGKVLSTDPAAGETVPTSTTIVMRIGAAPEQVEVPNLEGKSREEAEKLLNDKQLLLNSQVEEVEVQDENQVGKVVEQNPAAGTRAEQGSSVTITVGKSPDLVEVTNYEGKTFDEANAALTDAGFQVQRNDVDSDEPAGIVVRQQPNGGNVAPGSTITLDVSNGSQQQIEMPDLTGMTEDQAMAKLRDAGWSGNAQVETEEVSDSDDVGKVTNTNPPAGSQIAKDQKVVLYIGEQNGSTESSRPGGIPGLPDPGDSDNN